MNVVNFGLYKNFIYELVPIGYKIYVLFNSNFQDNIFRLYVEKDKTTLIRIYNKLKHLINYDDIFKKYQNLDKLNENSRYEYFKNYISLKRKFYDFCLRTKK